MSLDIGPIIYDYDYGYLYRGIPDMSDHKAVVQVSFADFTETTLSAVTRALAARRLPEGRFPGPIVMGLIWWPEGGPLQPVSPRILTESSSNKKED